VLGSAVGLTGCGGGSASRPPANTTSATGSTPIGPGDAGTGMPHGGATSQPGGRGGVNDPNAGGTGLPPDPWSRGDVEVTADSPPVPGPAPYGPGAGSFSGRS
jgi:hypothetical protein